MKVEIFPEKELNLQMLSSLNTEARSPSERKISPRLTMVKSQKD